MVLEGSVRKEGDKLRITAQLNKVADGYHLWSETYDREMKDALTIQNEIAQAIVTTLNIKLASAAGMTRRTRHAEAYNLYLKGCYFTNQPGGVKKSVDYFGQAIERDPNYALAYAGLSESWFYIGIFDPTQPREAFPNAEAAAKKALEIDDTLSEAHDALARVRVEKWDWPGAEKEYKRAIELSPNNAKARRGYAQSCLMLTDRLEQALQEIKRALDLDPISLEINGQFGWLLFLARQYDQAVEQSRKALEMNPKALGAHTTLGRIFVKKGMLAEAVAEFDKAEALNQQYSYWTGSLAGLYVRSGQRAEAEKLLEKWKRLSSREIGYEQAMAMIYEGLGDKNEAFRCLEKAYQEHSNRLPWIKVEPEFDGLRSDPRFHSLLKKMGLG